ncbi:hypothetical protein EM20IM_09080 [Candidatus Methylacidiphilum infernorum]|uniref:Uncharacterized protein n=1 Tax=Candidatus Methylacidiphilum infernorum TaxID=511746 RepID=A0ABX7PVJ6_9BACT|nr:hypothetical protein [Candidatus Methylacidiphilum infernorum]QSR86619.1 hypothetical protein EM20IM_09080 [Candidatus Methylacidiphilum infernorum]
MPGKKTPVPRSAACIGHPSVIFNPTLFFQYGDRSLLVESWRDISTGRGIACLCPVIILELRRRVIDENGPYLFSSEEREKA